MGMNKKARTEKQKCEIRRKCEIAATRKTEMEEMDTELESWTEERIVEFDREKKRLDAYTQRFQIDFVNVLELFSMKKTEWRGLLEDYRTTFKGNVIAANPARLQDVIRIANQLMDKEGPGYAARMLRIRGGRRVT
ncbi:hypothetical protein Tco_1316748 [Tanacetum coccineum]